MSDAQLVFLPWVRSGLAARVATPDPLTRPLPAQVRIDARIELNGAEGATMPLTLAAAGDVIGLDPRQVVRMEPPPGTADYESNDLAALEFDQPELPWMFTPAGADAQGRLRPWLVLVVVEDREGVQLRPPATEAVPVLQIAPPARPADELPDLADSWAWAHAQVAAPAGADAAALRALLAGAPERTVSRLIAPRLLKPFTRYLACVVPAFEAGRLAGLNLPLSGAAATQLAPAWASGGQAPAQVTLPVYHHWRFATGAREDFESIVRRLEARDLAGRVGRRPLDLAAPGFVFEGGPVEPLALEGALQPKDMPRAAWPDATATGWQAALRAIVNTAARPAAGSGDPLVGPPIIGRWHARRDQVGDAAPPTWLDDLNLDPRERVAAALGTRVVQDAQEALVAEAWDQAGELDRANQRLRQLQLSLVVGARLHARHVQALGDDDSALWRLAAPAQARLVWQPRTAESGALSLRGFLAGRNLPKALLSAPMRRLTRPGGEILRRAQLAIQPLAAPRDARAGPALATTRLGATAINIFSTPLATAVLDRLPSRGMVSFDAVTRRVPAGQGPRPYAAAHDQAVASTPARPDFRITLPPPVLGTATTVGASTTSTTFVARRPPRLAAGGPVEPPEPPEPPPPRPPRPPIPPRVDSGDAQAFRAAAQRHLRKVNPAGLVILGQAIRPALDVVASRATLVARLDPAPALRRRMAASVLRADGLPLPDDMGALGHTPRFDQAMSEPLAALSQDWLLPGLEHVPPDTVALLQPNRRFIEAYLAGLNVEMGRELLWRDYPLDDERATFFRRFWRGAQPGGDIEPLAAWGERRLGDHAPPGEVVEQSVLLVRSLLFRRYPGALVYAVPARRDARGRQPDAAAEHLQPLFRGALPPDVNFFGFALDPDEAAADPGWYFVIEQQPTEPRFGFDVDIDFGGARHVPLAAPPAGLALPPGTRWAHNAAHMGQITRQQPMRVAIHATELLAGLAR